MATARQIADYIIRFSQDRGDPITNLKLQKLVYYSHAWHLALTGRPLFSERIEAWVHGPVVPSLYQEFRGYKWNPISERPREPDLPDDIRKHLDEVLEVYGIETAYALERMTHQEEPWLKARGGIPEDQECRNPINDMDMLQFYKKMGDAEDPKEQSSKR
ncbi:SocA family protein [Skermanella sp. TT6]|uniref:SocA family protein n=1 Tax=Skermanella cutis TaxID=2775420 RepID=A0ABX7B0M2_9PROT|nr:type II toxin-antitoxin system antitoxin SocA domain-containing protein [Skermanella sp. TT6]QQP87875.1 SocA family protein [Skermanella sp. TT6]